MFINKPVLQFERYNNLKLHFLNSNVTKISNYNITNLKLPRAIIVDFDL